MYAFGNENNQPLFPERVDELTNMYDIGLKQLTERNRQMRRKLLRPPPRLNAIQFCNQAAI